MKITITIEANTAHFALRAAKLLNSYTQIGRMSLNVASEMIEEFEAAIAEAEGEGGSNDASS